MPKGKKQQETSTESVQVDPEITDAVTETGVAVTGEAPTMAMGDLYQTIGNSVAMAAANDVLAQHQANVSFQAVSAVGTTNLLKLPLT